MAKAKQPVMTEEKKRDLRLKEIIVETFRQHEQYFPQPQDAVIYRRSVMDYAVQAIEKFKAEMAAKDAESAEENNG